MPAAVFFYSILFLVLVLFPALLILVFLLFVDHEYRFWRQFGTTAEPKRKMLWEGASLRRLSERFPSMVSFISRRLDPHDAWGLPATLATIGVLAGVWFFLGIVQDLIGKYPLVLLDLRLHNSVPLFRSPGVTWFMLGMTEVGSPVVLWILCIGIALIALARDNRRLAAAFLLAIAATSSLSPVLKAVIGHARPGDAIIAVHEASFPSGHVLSSAVIYGLLASLLLRSHARRSLRAVGTALLLLLVACIGVSRLYLGVHWPSDLLGSLAIALICLALVLFFLRYERQLTRIDQFNIPLSAQTLRWTGALAFVVAAATGAYVARNTTIIAIGPPAPDRPVLQGALLTGLPAGIRRRSESLIGKPMEPISLVLVGSLGAMIETFARAGWTKADHPTPVRVVKEILAAFENRQDASGPATPAYIADRPQTLTFEKPDPSSPDIRHRHHVRVWQTQYCAMPGCRPIWVATASFDAGIELSPRLHLPTHRIDPNIDAERALIVFDLTGAGATKRGTIAIVPPLNGSNAAGDAFTTDGRAVILEMPPT